VLALELARHRAGANAPICTVLIAIKLTRLMHIVPLPEHFLGIPEKNDREGVPMTNWAEQAETQYAALVDFSEMRRRELLPLLEPYTRVADQYGELVCRIILILGQVPPKTTLDSVTRDLAADVFDFLHEARTLIERGMPHIAYPLARRAFESLCLVVASNQDEAVALRWQSGVEVKFYKLRDIFSTHPLGESKVTLKDTYSFFSEATHPRRGLVAERHLGDGNAFVLGAIGSPELILLADYCIITLSLWFWFGAFLRWTYREILAQRDTSLPQAYHEAATNAEAAKKWLREQHDRLLTEMTDGGDPGGI
jgi:hypothetical protein